MNSYLNSLLYVLTSPLYYIDKSHIVMWDQIFMTSLKRKQQHISWVIYAQQL